jgi:hypothetical protein
MFLTQPVPCEGRQPHLQVARSLQNWRRSRIITGCSVHTRGVSEHKRFLLLWQDNGCFIEANLDDRQAAEETQVQKGVEWISQ